MRAFYANFSNPDPHWSVVFISTLIAIKSTGIDALFFIIQFSTYMHRNHLAVKMYLIVKAWNLKPDTQCGNMIIQNDVHFYLKKKETPCLCRCRNSRLVLLCCFYSLIQKFYKGGQLLCQHVSLNIVFRVWTPKQLFIRAGFVRDWPSVRQNSRISVFKFSRIFYAWTCRFGAVRAKDFSKDVRY